MSRLSFYIRREWLNLILLIALVGLALDCGFAPRGVRDLLLLKRKSIELETRQHDLRLENEALETSVQKLRSDDAYLCRMIRKELGFAKPGEIIYRFASDTNAATPP